MQIHSTTTILPAAVAPASGGAASPVKVPTGAGKQTVSNPSTSASAPAVPPASAPAVPAASAPAAPAAPAASVSAAASASAPNTSTAPKSGSVKTTAPQAQAATETAATSILDDSVYSTNVGGKSYAANISQSNGTYTLSVPNVPGASVTGSSLFAAETALYVKINTLA